MVQKFSDPFVRSAPIGYHWDASLNGFGLRVNKNSRVFIFLRSSGNRETIGRYPAISLSEARAEAKDRLAKRQLGYVAPKPTLTFSDALALFLKASELSKRPRTIKDARYHLNRHWLPVFGSRRLSEIARRDITNELSNLSETPSEADHALRNLKAFFSWTVNSGYIDYHPCSRMPTIGQNNTRDRVLSDDEITAIWKATEEPTHHNVIVRLLLLTGQRRGEIAALRNEWIGDGMITLPKAICKNGREHTFPVGALTADVLNSLTGQSDLLFPARGSNAEKSFNGWSKSKAALDKASSVQNWTLHDLRRTFATKLAAIGIPQPVTEKLLNHVSGMHSGVAGIYNRHSYWGEMKAAVALYETHLTLLFGS